MELLNYLLKVSACTTMFFEIYLLVLRRLTFFKINRYYLLVTLLFSFVIPSLHFTIQKELPAVKQEIVYPTENITESNIDLANIPIITPTPTETVSFNWAQLITPFYSIISFLLLIISLWRIMSLLKHIKKDAVKIGRMKLVPKNGGFTNCSFFNYVFFDESKLTDTELQILLEHESVHINQYHSVDKILMLLAKTVLWLNPIVYLYDKALEEVHEFEADSITSNQFGTSNYADLLLRLAVSKSDLPLVHNFVKSPVKERIKMLFNPKSKNMRKLSYLLALPVVAVLLWSFTVDVVGVYPQKSINLSLKKEIIQKDTFPKSIAGKLLGYIKESKPFKTARIQTKDSVVKVHLTAANQKLLNIGDEYIFEVVEKLNRNHTMTPPPPRGTKPFYEILDIYLPSKIYNKENKLLYEFKITKYAFLYEANRARYANSKIVAIGKSNTGIINYIKLNDGEFSIKLNVASLQKKAIDFKVGDEVEVKFIGESKLSEKSYETNKLIALYSVDKSRTLISERLYNKFYLPNGKQKVSFKTESQTKIGATTKDIIPTVVTSESASVDSYIGNKALKKSSITAMQGQQDTTLRLVGSGISANAVVYIDGKLYPTSILTKISPKCIKWTRSSYDEIYLTTKNGKVEYATKYDYINKKIENKQPTHKLFLKYVQYDEKGNKYETAVLKRASGGMASVEIPFGGKIAIIIGGKFISEIVAANLTLTDIKNYNSGAANDNIASFKNRPELKGYDAYLTLE